MEDTKVIKYTCNLDERLKHLNKDEIIELINQYYSGESSKKLIEKYNINISISKLYTLFPPIVHEDIICPYCNITMITKRVPKSALKERNKPYCPICYHSYSEDCKCNKCETERSTKRQKILDEKIRLIHETYDVCNVKAINFEDISFIDKVYLGALLRVGLTEDLNKVKPMEENYYKLCPTQKFRDNIIEKLMMKNVLKIHPESPVEAFDEFGKCFPNKFYMNKVYFYLNISSTTSKAFNEIVDMLINPKIDYNDHKLECYELWKEIALDECKEYLLYSMNKVGLTPFNIGDKTISMLNDLLENFSVSQIYSIIYNAINEALRYYHTNNVYKKQSANYVIGKCQRIAERRLANSWETYKYKRNFDCPQSLLSDFIYNRVMKIGDDGFNLKPQIIEK